MPVKAKLPVSSLPLSVIERYASKIIRVNECWEYTGANYNSKGYKAFSYKYNRYPAHRIAYSLVNGEIPLGLVLDHLCRNVACVNPAHLEAVTNYVNVVVRGTGVSALNKLKTHCPHGHPYTTENTRISRRRGGVWRECVECRRRIKHGTYVRWKLKQKAKRLTQPTEGGEDEK